MSRWLAIPLLLFLCALGVAAQDQPLTLAHKTPCFVCDSFTDSYRPSEPTITLAENPQPKSASRVLFTMTGEPDLEAWERLHQKFHRTFPMQHNPRLYAITARILTGFYSRSPQFTDRYRRVRGFDLLRLAGGRFALGFETQRVLLTERDFGSRPIRDTSIRTSVGLVGSGPCGSFGLRAGESRYSLAFRWNLKLR
jgi:hypothetical protein